MNLVFTQFSCLHSLCTYSSWNGQCSRYPVSFLRWFFSLTFENYQPKNKFIFRTKRIQSNNSHNKRKQKREIDTQMHNILYTNPFKQKTPPCQKNAGACTDACAATGSSKTIKFEPGSPV